MVRILTAMTAAMLSAGVAAAPGVEPAQQQIRQVVADISPQRIEAHVRKLVGFQTRHTMSDTVSDTCGIGAADGNRQRGGDPAGQPAAVCRAHLCRQRPL